MDENIKTWLFDILQSIEEIDSYFESGNRRYDFYINDIKTKRAVERDLEIIGEAVNRIKKAKPDFELTNARQIIATRNKISHAYDSISNEMVWGILINHLPRLRAEIEKMFS